MSIKYLKNISKEIWGFSFYDFANSAYLLIFGTLLFPIYFKETVFKGASKGDLYWGLLLSSSVLLATLIGPLIGHLADITNRWKLFSLVILFVFLGEVAISIFVSFSKISPFYFSILFILTNCFYILSVTLYNSFIFLVSNKKNRGLISAFSWGFGYLGGTSCFIIVLLYSGGKIETSYQVFFITAIFYLLFSAISLSWLPKRTNNIPHKENKFPYQELINKKMIILLLGFWFINESIVTITFFVALFGRGTLNLNISTIGILFLIVQVVAFPATWFMGYLSKKYGEVKVIKLTIYIWAIVLIGLSMSNSLLQLVILSLISAFVIGSTQALMRAYYANLHKECISGSAFGIYAVITRTSAIVGPIIFGFVSEMSGSQRVAILSVLLPLLIGYLLFNYYDKNYMVPHTNRCISGGSGKSLMQ